jgi:hypothetical protein
MISLTAVVLSAQAPDPDALVASVEKAATALAKAQKAATKGLVKEGYESDEEFAARKAAAADLSGTAYGNDYAIAVGELESAIFEVAATKLKVTAAPFDTKGKTYTFTVTSNDPAVPFTGTVVYSIKDSQDLKGDFTKVEAALKAKTLGASLTYRITKRATGYRVNGLTCEVGIGLGNEDALQLASTAGSEAWDFVVGKRAKPTVAVWKVGEPGPAGGLVFYDKSKTTKGWRYLEAAPEDASSGIRWDNGGDNVDVKTDTEIGSGKANTEAILAAQGSGRYAAQLCYSLNTGGFSDWFLPSKEELNLLHTVLATNGLGGFAKEYYWSSSQCDGIGFAWKKGFGSGNPGIGRKYDGRYVRAVRAF